MLPNRIVLYVVMCVVGFACASGSSFPAGAACQSDFECGDGYCGDWPGGYCFKARCQLDSECGLDGYCLPHEGTTVCVARCYQASDCRAGYVCTDGPTRPGAAICVAEDDLAAWTGAGGSKNPANNQPPPNNSAPKRAAGASCSQDAQCADGICETDLPDGYCTAMCNSSSDCTGDAVCVDTGNGYGACFARCDTPGSQSSCRSGYVCWGLKTRDDGICGPYVQPTNNGAGGGTASGGSGGGTSSSGGGTNSGSSGMTTPHLCRTYATSFTVVTTGGTQTITAQHTAKFDRTALTLTDTWTDSSGTSSSVNHYPSLAAFVEEASTMLEGKGGPTRIDLTSSAGSQTITQTYDSYGRFTGATDSVGGHTAFVETYSAWDSAGRNMTGSIDTYVTSTEKCLAQAINVERNDTTRTSVVHITGGTNFSAVNAQYCHALTTTTHYDQQFMIMNIIHATVVPTQDTYTNHSTEVVCD